MQDIIATLVFLITYFHEH